ncbi:DUF2325 domain-containing protein [Pollutimonas bauzanensis]|nr:DUF2325 domain-containing protein [Pollutimonas bauzanensis]
MCLDFERLQQEHIVLMTEYGRAQYRASRVVRKQAAMIERLEAQVMMLRAAVISRDSALAWARDDYEALAAAAPGLAKRADMARELEALKARIGVLMRERTARRASAAPHSGVDLPAERLAEADLYDKAVLCIGQDEASATLAQRAIENSGGRFLRHDGIDGKALETSLVDADLVICQTGCVSHGTYWRVKDHCTRTGKQCVLVDRPDALDRVRARRASSALPEQE